MAQEKLKVSVQEVESLLEKGMDRQEIAEHFGVPYSILQKTVFQHPKLKGRKKKKIYDIEVFDESEEGNTLDMSASSDDDVAVQQEPQTGDSSDEEPQTETVSVDNSEEGDTSTDWD